MHGDEFTHMFCLMLLTLAATELSLLWDTWRCVYTPVLSYAVNTSNHRIITAVGCMEMSLHTCFVLDTSHWQPQNYHCCGMHRDVFTHMFCLMLLTLATTELSLLSEAWRCVYTHVLS